MDALWIFPDVESAGRGVDSLVKAGFAEERITSLTSAPYPDGVLVKDDRPSWLHRLSLAGGAGGAALGFLLAAGTAMLYPVQTGDKPIIAFYPTGIITFELTMLFAILGAVAGMFLELRLPPREERLYDPVISEGCIGISVSVPSEDEVRRVEQIMQESGALSFTSSCGSPSAPVRRILEGQSISSKNRRDARS